jgi:soluble lytic murein transglycosylase
MNATVRSPVGALGLMQVMPATAEHTARKKGLSYRGSSDLLQPATNVEIGSTYMRMMLDRFADNRILAAAAYNAGPGRVNQWLARLPGAEVEHDRFVETIPFRETRKYVQNVLTYAVIYAYLQGRSAPVVQPSEKLIRKPSAAAR